MDASYLGIIKPKRSKRCFWSILNHDVNEYRHWKSESSTNKHKKIYVSNTTFVHTCMKIIQVRWQNFKGGRFNIISIGRSFSDFLISRLWSFYKAFYFGIKTGPSTGYDIQMTIKACEPLLFTCALSLGMSVNDSFVPAWISAWYKI